MGVIAFKDSPDCTWHVANWAFFQLVDDVCLHYKSDVELVEALQNSKLYYGLSLDLIEPSVAEQLKGAIARVSNGIIEGELESSITSKPFADTATVTQYKESLRELLKIVSHDHIAS
jgi:hypothetical protein